MKKAIIGGSGFYKMVDGQFEHREIDTVYGKAYVSLGTGEYQDLVFMPRHGKDHSVPPHKINYRANIKALQQLEVGVTLAVFTVGSLHEGVPPHGMVVLDQFLDFTSGRESTFFDGGDSGVIHVEMNEPFCEGARQALLRSALDHGLTLIPTGTYVSTNGPRFETPAEIKMYAQVGGDVVGMTCAPEVTLARELQIHYAAVALSVNWAAGLTERIELFEDGLEEKRTALMHLFLDVLGQELEGPCECDNSQIVTHPPKEAI